MALVNKYMTTIADGSSGGSSKTTTTGKWTSYQDAANAGYANIRTQSEFARGGSDKNKYGTYQAYLDAMYDKYMGTPTVTTPAAPLPPAPTYDEGLNTLHDKYVEDKKNNPTVVNPAPQTQTTTQQPTQPTSVPKETDVQVAPNSNQTPAPAPVTYGEALESGNTQPEQVQTPETTPAAPTETTPTPAAPASSGTTIDTSDPIMSYEEWYQKQNEEFAGIRDETVKYWDDKSARDIAAAEQAKTAADSYAEEQKRLLDEAAQKAKETAYTAAEQQLMADLEFSKAQYQLLLDSINAAKESGLTLAAEQRDLLLKMSEEQKTAVYAAAEAQREQEYEEAEIARQRKVVDARSNYEQNKASYGARAEAAGDMGLSVSGYTDYINQQAYATQRAESYAANSEAEAAKRAARYTENQQKFAADQDYAQNQYEAQAQYGKDKYAVETSYQQNMLAADQQKGQRDYEANAAERAAKNAADQAYIENQYASESTYNENLYKSSAALEEAKKKAKDESEAGKLEAELSYRENVLGITDKYVEYADSQKAKNKEASTVKYDLAGNVTGDTTDSEIDELVDDEIISEEDGEYLKAIREKQATSDVYSYLDGGDIQSAQAIAERYYKNGSLSKDAYQTFYYDATIKNVGLAASVDDVLDIAAQIKNLKGAGKLSATGAKNAEDFLYKSFGKVLSPSTYQTDYTKNVFGTTVKNSQLMTVTINGAEYDISTDISGTTANFANSDTSNVLSAMVGGAPKNGVLAEIGDQIYVYRTGLSNGDGWVKVNHHVAGFNTTSKDFYETYDKLVGRQPTAQPRSSTETSDRWTSYEDASAAGYPNIRTKSEFARGGSDKTKYGTYQAYLDAMYDKYVG